MTETISNYGTPTLHSVIALYATKEPDVLRMVIDLTDAFGERYESDFYYREGDTSGLSPMLTQWLAENEGNYTIAPYVPPTAEEVRAGMLPLSRVAFRKAFKDAGMTTSFIVAAIFSIDDEDEREDYEIAWQDSVEFKRLDPLVLLIADRAGKTAEEIDAAWLTGLSI
jgi:hypothetical protein